MAAASKTEVKLSASHPHAEDLEGGRVLAPGEVAKVRDEELKGDKAKALVDSGALFVLDDKKKEN